MKVGHKSRNKRHATTTNDRSTGGSFIRGLVAGAVFCLAVLLLGYMFMNIRTEKLPPDGIAPLTDILDPSPTAATPTAAITPLSELLSLDTPSSPSPITAVHAIEARPLKQRQTGDGMVSPAVITTTVGTVESTAGSSSSSSSGSSHLRTSASSSNSNSISRSSKSFTDLLKMNISSLLPHYTKVTQPTLHPLSTF